MEDIVERGYVIIGSPDEVVAQLPEVASDLNVGHLMLLMQFGRMGKDLAAYNTKLFAEQVLPRLKGFGSEEGYIHEKFRRAGARTLCLPFLRWVHRFGRPMGARYENSWEDRIRNCLVVAGELGSDGSDVVEHFRAHLGVETANRIIASVLEELRNSF